MMHGDGKSDRPIVPKKLPNKDTGAPESAEEAEGRGLAKRNSSEQNSLRTQRRTRLQNALARVRQVAERDQEVQFTALWHHVYDTDRLREAFLGLKRNASAGIDGQTWFDYEADLEGNLTDLASRLKRGAYRAKPVQRVLIPKPDGRQRPIGVPVLEDKIVQSATAEVLNAIYEADFLAFSYGFRPERSQHDALDAVSVGLTMRKVDWVLDADIRGFFDAIDHGWLIKFLEHRIADQRVLRHIKKWLNAGVLEEGEWRRVEAGTPQGGSISPLLANVYLHYAFDLWADRWRRKRARGDVIVVRYADDTVLGFQHRDEADRFLRDLKARLRRFRLELHPEKTHLIEFGRFAAVRRSARGLGKPATFDFLGFTHCCGTTRKGGFVVKRRTMRTRVRRKLADLKVKLRRRMHVSIPEVGRWLTSVLRGYYQYYAVPLNLRALCAFRWAVARLWRATLNRRSHKRRVTWTRMHRLSARWLPHPKILHPWPANRLRV